MIFLNKDLGLKIDVEESLLYGLANIGRESYPHEFGGFLVGRYSNNFRELIITNSILPTKFRTSRVSFERETIGIEKELKQLYKKEPPEYYVGEWHTHPDSKPIPSVTDYKAMDSIAGHPTVAICNPILLIIGYSKTEVDLAFYVFLEKKLIRYE